MHENYVNSISRRAGLAGAEGQAAPGGSVSRLVGKPRQIAAGHASFLRRGDQYINQIEGVS